MIDQDDLDGCYECGDQHLKVLCPVCEEPLCGDCIAEHSTEKNCVPKLRTA